MKDQKKRTGFMCVFIYCSYPLSHFQAWHPFRVHVKWVGYPLPPSPDYSIESILHRLVTLPVIHGVWCLFRRVILSDIPTSLKIVCLETYSLSSPSYSPSCVSLTLIITSSTLVSCQLMEDASWPPFDRFLPVDLSTSSKNDI